MPDVRTCDAILYSLNHILFTLVGVVTAAIYDGIAEAELHRVYAWNPNEQLPFVKLKVLWYVTLYRWASIFDVWNDCSDCHKAIISLCNNNRLVFVLDTSEIATSFSNICSTKITLSEFKWRLTYSWSLKGIAKSCIITVAEYSHVSFARFPG